MSRCGAVAAVLVAMLGVTASFGQVGLWPDEIVFFETSDCSEALRALKSGDAHLTATSFDPWDLGYAWANSALSYGTSYELWLNPESEYREPVFSDGRFNPLALPAVREALSLLIDQERFACDVMGEGLGIGPRWTVLDPRFSLHAEEFGACGPVGIPRVSDEEKAIQMIHDAMLDVGCELVESEWDSHGWWYYGSDLVEVVGLFVDDAGYTGSLYLGDYISDQLEKAGIVVEQRRCTEVEAERMWRLADLVHGEWGFYVRETTPESIDRTPLDDFDLPYAWAAGWASSGSQSTIDLLWSVADLPLMDDLAGARFNTWSERSELLAESEAAAQWESWHRQLFNVDREWAWAEDVEVLVDLAAGVAGSYLWGHTVRFVDEDGDPDRGGRIDVACPALFEEAWNPIGGTTSIVARMIQRATEDWFLYPDPNTGLFVSHLVDSATCTVPYELAMTATHEYVTVDYEDNIAVPDDAWCAWVPDNCEFVTVGERYPDGLTARTKTVCTFYDDLFDNLWHDGSHFSLADMVMRFIWRFQRGDEMSVFYAETQGWEHTRFLQAFKGARITSTDPLTIEVYDDRVCSDPETQVFERIGELFWPYYGAGMAPWHTIAVGLHAFDWDWGMVFAETAAAFHGYRTPVQQNWITGPTLEDLFWHVDEIEESAILGELTSDSLGFPSVCGLIDVVDDAEVNERFRNLGQFIDAYGHMWIGNGPLMIDYVDVEGGAIYGARFDAYRHDVARWLDVGEPALATIELPDWLEIRAGEPKPIEVLIFIEDGGPYPMDEIESVSFEISAADEEQSYCDIPRLTPPLLCGQADLVDDGLARIELSAGTTADLLESTEGEYIRCWLDVVAVLKPVAVTAQGSMEIWVVEGP